MALPAQASSPADVYTVTGVPVDATAASSQLARDQAIAQGQRRAIRLLMERLAMRADHSRLPQVDAGAVADLVSGFEVANERVSPVRYLADLTVAFRPDSVRALLQGAGIAVADTPSRPILVLPVWRVGDDLQLFDERNPWRAVWLKVAAGKGLVPLLTPLGDLADLQAISPEQAAGGEPAALAAIARRYGTGGVIVAFATAGEGETIAQLVVSRFDAGGQRAGRVNVAPRSPPDALLATAIAISQEAEESWKATALLDTATVGTLDAAVPVQQLSEWIAIRRQLSSVPAVQRVDVRSLGVGAAQITLHHAGTPQQLRVVLEQANLILAEGPEGWVLRARAAPAPGSGQAPAATTPTPTPTPAPR